MKISLFFSFFLACSVVFADGTGVGLTGQYFDDLKSAGHLLGTPVANRVDPYINFDFAKTPPPGLSRTTNFSVRWTGKVLPRYSERYLFMTYSDGGIQVLLNGNLLINNWNYHPGTWNWNWINVQAGQLYDIEVRYFETSTAADVQLWWQSASQSKEIVAQTQLYGPTQLNEGVTYYVSPTGNDVNSGLTVGQPWRTIARVNQQPFEPGDKVLFQRGGRYGGSIEPQGSGVPGYPIMLSAYGVGAAPVIDGSTYESTIKLFNQQYWAVNSLDITGGQRFGIWVSGDKANQVLHSITISNLAVHDLYSTPRWDSGLIMVAPIGDHLTFDNVVVDSVRAYNTNLWYGIHVGFNLWYSYPTLPPRTTNVTVRNCTVHDVYGDGITVAQAQKVLIERNLAFNTGLAPAGISYTPNGIWSWQTDQATIQYNEGYATHSYAYDGGVFDIDWGSTNTIVQYNYAHDAQGYCVAIMGAHHVTTVNSIVRFNICSNNVHTPGTHPNHGDIFITTFDGGSLDGIQVYNNTAYWDPSTDGGWVKGRSLAMTGTNPRFIENNIIYSNSQTMIDLDSSIALDHNLYWSEKTATPTWKYGSFTASSIADFARLTGQEQSGIVANPLLNNPTYDGIGKPTTQLTLLPGSPAVGRASAWVGMGSWDFFGNVLPKSGTPDIGAHYPKPN